MSNSDTPFCSKKCWYDSELKSLVGQQFGQLTVIERNRQDSITFYNCKCMCGNVTTVTHTNLLSGTTKSCGCLQKQLLSKRSTKSLDEVVAAQVFNYYKRNAKTRSLSWDLSKKQVLELITKQCSYCGLVGTNTTKVRVYKQGKPIPNVFKTFQNNGIDRIDNSLGYSLRNSVPCCKHCNFAKHERTYEEFKEWAITLYTKLTAS